MISSDKQMPGYVSFAWMFFMQPLRLRQRLKACGIEDPDAPARQIWRDPAPDLQREYVKRCFGILLSMIPLVLGIALLARPLGMTIDLSGVALGAALGVALGARFGFASGVVRGVAFGGAFSVIAGLAAGVASGGVQDLTGEVGVFIGVAGGIAFGVAVGLIKGLTGEVNERLTGLAGGLTYGLLLGLPVGLALGVAYGMNSGGPFGVVVGVLMGGWVSLIIGGAGGMAFVITEVAMRNLIQYSIVPDQPKTGERVLQHSKPKRTGGLLKGLFIAVLSSLAVTTPVLFIFLGILDESRNVSGSGGLGDLAAGGLVIMATIAVFVVLIPVFFLVSIRRPSS